MESKNDENLFIVYTIQFFQAMLMLIINLNKHCVRELTFHCSTTMASVNTLISFMSHTLQDLTFFVYLINFSTTATKKELVRVSGLFSILKSTSHN